MTQDDAERIARAFHDTYERLAPSYGYQTREASRTHWALVPAENKKLMIAVACDLLDRGVIHADVGSHDNCRCRTLLVRLGFKPAPPIYGGICRRCGKTYAVTIPPTTSATLRPARG